jgi:hypothetical protein
MSNQHSFYNRHRQQLHSGFEALLGGLFLLIASVTLLRVETTPAPIYASDEYAYLKHGLNLGKPLVVGPPRDPGLQEISNSVYSWIVRLAGRLTGDPTPVIRVVNFVCYFVVLPLLGGWLLLRHSGRSAVFLFIGLLAVLPSGVFVLSPMPEILFATVYTVIAVLVILLLGPAPTCAGLVGGMGLAMLAYIKPHALAAMAGFAIFFLIHSLKRWREREWPRRLLLFIFLAGVALGIFCINAIILGQLTFVPQFVGNVYAGTVQAAFSWSHFLQAAETLIRFACLHTLILIMLFPLAFAGALLAVIRLFYPKVQIAWSVFDDLSLLTLICATTFTAMIAHFTHYAAAGGAFESNRLHGRYLIALFPSLLLITAHLFSTLRRPSESQLGSYLRNRWVIGAFLVTVMVTCWFLRHAKLFPWDYPELFSLYSEPNNYCGWIAPLHLRAPIFATGLLLLLACLIRPFYVPRLFVLAQAMFFGASLFFVTFWQETHARRNAPLAAAGRILRTNLGPQGEDLLLVGSDRYGNISYVLCGLLGNPWVKILPNNADFAASMVPSGVKVVATLGSYNVKFPFVSYTENGPLRVYGLDASTIHTYSVPTPFCGEKELVIHTGNKERNAVLFGFNSPEPWGAWTSDDEAVVLLPCWIQGHLHLKFRSWVQTMDRSNVALTIGDAVLSFQPGTTPAEFDLPASLVTPADRIGVHYHATRANPWERRVGVAVSEIAISPEH